MHWRCFLCDKRFFSRDEAEIHSLGHEMDGDPHSVILMRDGMSIGFRGGNMPTWEVLAHYNSRSTDVVYEVRRGHDGVIYCTCPAWRTKGGKASCKHIDEWRRENYTRPQSVTRDSALRMQHIKMRDIIEVNSRGDVFLLKVDALEQKSATSGTVSGVELLDEGEAPVNRDGRRVVDFRDIVRIVAKDRS